MNTYGSVCMRKEMLDGNVGNVLAQKVYAGIDSMIVHRMASAASSSELLE